MNENNANIKDENKEVITPFCSSRFLMSKELFYEFGSVNYNGSKKVFLICLCLVASLIGMYILAGDDDVIFGYCIFISCLMLSTYFRTNKSIEISYEQNLISEGKESTLNHELFEDKIVSYVNERKREYSYHQITELFETKNFILLHIKHNFYITIEKSSLNASVDDVKTFLLNKCTLVKKKKFINCTNDKKCSLMYLIALVVACVAGMIAALVMKITSVF